MTVLTGEHHGGSDTGAAGAGTGGAAAGAEVGVDQGGAGPGGSGSAQTDGASGSNGAGAAAASVGGTGAGADANTAGAGDSAGAGNVESGASADSGASDAKAEAAGAPAAYADFTLPEGLTVNTELLGALKETAKSLNLTQAQAQQLADLGAKQAQALLVQQSQALETQKLAWADAARADKEFGGDKFAENLAVAKRALNAFVSDDLKALLDSTGLGNHPDMIRAFYKAGTLISEDKLLPGGKSSGNAGQKSAAQVLYG